MGRFVGCDLRPGSGNLEGLIQSRSWRPERRPVEGPGEPERLRMVAS